MDNPLTEGVGVFQTVIPVMVAVVACCTVSYLILIHRHLQMAAAIGVWFVFVYATTPFWQFVTGLQWDLAEDLPGVIVVNLLFGTPLIVFLAAFWRSESFRDFMLKEVPAVDLIAWQTGRIAGSVYLYIFFNETITNLVCLQVGVFDLTISITALPLYFYVKSVGLTQARRIVQAWNIFGILDLCIPFALFPFNLFGVLYTPEQDLSFFMLFPIVIVFLFNVPLAMLNHFVVLLNYDKIIKWQEGEMAKEFEIEV